MLLMSNFFFKWQALILLKNTQFWWFKCRLTRRTDFKYALRSSLLWYCYFVVMDFLSKWALGYIPCCGRVSCLFVCNVYLIDVSRKITSAFIIMEMYYVQQQHVFFSQKTIFDCFLSDRNDWFFNIICGELL